MKKTWSQYRFELIALVFALLGIFLLVEPFQIRATLWRLLGQMGTIAARVASGPLNLAQRLLNDFSTSDLLGLALICLALVIVAWRLRVHFLNSPNWTKSECPRCGSERIVRVHRTPLDRMMATVLIVPIYRFKCRNQKCRWSGQRFGKHHRHWSPRRRNEELAGLYSSDRLQRGVGNRTESSSHLPDKPFPKPPGS